MYINGTTFINAININAIYLYNEEDLLLHEVNDHCYLKGFYILMSFSFTLVVDFHINKKYSGQTVNQEC